MVGEKPVVPVKTGLSVLKSPSHSVVHYRYLSYLWMFVLAIVEAVKLNAVEEHLLR